MRSRSWLVAGGFLVGATAGWMLAQRRLLAHRRELFSPQPLRRMAALGFLAGQGGVDTIRLLRDYLSWERHPMLRRRADVIVRRLEANLAAMDPVDATSAGAGFPDATLS